MLTRVLTLCIVLLATSLASADGERHVYLNTSLGDMVIELYPDKAPGTVANFLKYVDEGFYEKTVFHRVIGHFMAQGGGLDVDGSRLETHPAIQNEADNGLKNLKYTLAMARTAGAHTATSQFFINATHNKALDHKSKSNGRSWGYCVFGKVVAGMETVDLILDTPVEYDPRMNATSKPVTPIHILEAKALSAAEAETRMKDVGGRNPDADLLARQLEDAKGFLTAREVDLSNAYQTGSGLWFVPVEPGSGLNPGQSDRVEVHYTGWHVDGKKFDSSRDRGKPSEFGLNQVIKGWTEGLQLMKPGGRAYLVIPWDLAYGDKAGRMPAKSTLIFDVELISVKKKPRERPVEVQMEEAQKFLTKKEVDLSKAFKTDSGLWVVHASEGQGQNPSKTDSVEVHYTGWLTNGNKFDSSKDRGRPLTFKLTQVIKGWTEGLQHMKPGGKTYLVIPPDIAYGQAKRPTIPANSVLIFEVELLSIK